MNKKRTKGFTLVEVMIVVLVIGLLISIAIPQMMTARRNAAKRTCQSNLRIFDAVKAQYAIEMRANSGDPVVLADLMPYIRRTPECPMGGNYDFGTVGSHTACDIAEHPNPEL